MFDYCYCYCESSLLVGGIVVGTLSPTWLVGGFWLLGFGYWLCYCKGSLLVEEVVVGTLSPIRLVDGLVIGC